MKNSRFSFIFIKRSVILIPVIAVILFSFGGCSSPLSPLNSNQKKKPPEFTASGAHGLIPRLKTSSIEGGSGPCGAPFNPTVANSIRNVFDESYYGTIYYPRSPLPDDYRNEAVGYVDQNGNYHAITPTYVTSTTISLPEGAIPPDATAIIHYHVYQNYEQVFDTRSSDYLDYIVETEASNADQDFTNYYNLPMYVVAPEAIRLLEPGANEQYSQVYPCQE